MSLPLLPSAGPSWVLFKESFLPGWSATLETPFETHEVAIVGGELDFMMLRLDSVPAGSRLLLAFGPTSRVYLSWALSAAGALLACAWLLRPRPFAALAGAAWALVSRGWTSEDG